MNRKEKEKKNKKTILVHSGRDKKYTQGAVNIPPYRASTVLFESLAEYQSWDLEFNSFRYGRLGSPNSFALEKAYSELSGAYRSIATSSGMSAINIAVTPFVNQGDHILVTEGVYEPAGYFFNNHLAPFGVEVNFFSPLIHEEIGSMIQSNTRVVYLESPSSITFELQDIEMLVSAVRQRSSELGINIVIIFDNTWAGPLYFRPLEHDIDIEVQAATKYIVGHSDAMLGIVACSKDTSRAVRGSSIFQGISASPDECYLGLRGMRTMAVRMEQQFQDALLIAEWLNEHAMIQSVLYPPSPFSEYHDYWKKLFSGGGSLMGIVLTEQYSEEALARMFDQMDFFAMGASYGGFESLLIPSKLQYFRQSGAESYTSTMLRLYVGLEDCDDLIQDLDKGLARLKHS